MINKLVSIKNSVQSALDSIGAENTRMVPVLTTWGVYADDAIGGYRLLTKRTEVLTFTCNYVELPEDTVCILPCFLWGDHGCDCNNSFTESRWIIDNSFLGISQVGSFVVIDNSAANPVKLQGKYEIQDNKMVFPCNYDGEKITIQIIAYKRDQEGFIMINQNHVEACAQYMQYRLAKQTRFKTKEYRLSDTAILDERREWNRMCRDARATDGEATGPELENAINIINNPYSGIRGGYWLYNKSPIFGLV